MKTQVESKITKKKEFTRTGRRKKLANVKIVQSKDGEEKKRKNEQIRREVWEPLSKSKYM